MMLYLLTFMTCMGSECMWVQLERPTLDDCISMKRQVIAEARQEEKRITAICTGVYEE